MWSDLGLYLSPEFTNIYHDRPYDGLGFSIILRAVVCSFNRKQCNDDVSHTSDNTNLQPPTSVPTRKLEAIHFMIEFSATLCGRVPSIKHEHNHNARQRYSPYIQLTDAVLRTFICQRPVRMIGARIVANQCPTPLARIAPSIFCPGYTDRMSTRSVFIEPITQILLAYLHNRKEEYTRFPESDGRFEGVDVKSEERLNIERDLWTTMAEALWNEEDARRLRKLEYTPDEPIEVSHEAWEDIAQDLMETHQATSLLGTDYLDERFSEDHSLFDFPMGPQSYAQNRIRSGSNQLSQQTTTDYQSGISFVYNSSAETILESQYLDNHFRPVQGLACEKVATHWMHKTFDSQDDNDVERMMDNSATAALNGMKIHIPSSLSYSGDEKLRHHVRNLGMATAESDDTDGMIFLDETNDVHAFDDRQHTAMARHDYAPHSSNAQWGQQNLEDSSTMLF